MSTLRTSRPDQQAELDRLQARLEDGFDKIYAAQAAGEDVSRWEDVWLRLLSDYERLYDELAGGPDGR